MPPGSHPLEHHCLAFSTQKKAPSPEGGSKKRDPTTKSPKSHFPATFQSLEIFFLLVRIPLSGLPRLETVIYIYIYIYIISTIQAHISLSIYICIHIYLRKYIVYVTYLMRKTTALHPKLRTSAEHARRR